MPCECLNETNQLLDILRELRDESSTREHTEVLERQTQADSAVTSTPNSNNLDIPNIDIPEIIKTSFVNENFLAPNRQKSINSFIHSKNPVLESSLLNFGDDIYDKKRERAEFNNLDSYLNNEFPNSIVQRADVDMIKNQENNLQPALPQNTQQNGTLSSQSCDNISAPVSNNLTNDCVKPVTCESNVSTVSTSCLTSQQESTNLHTEASYSAASVFNPLTTEPVAPPATRANANTQIPEVKRQEISAKLKKLESDLKLVEEVQAILNGIQDNNLNHFVFKRDIDSMSSDDVTPDLELNINFETAKPNVIGYARLRALEKAYKWKAAHPKAHNRKKKHYRERIGSRFRRKLFGNRRRFLAQRHQNFK